MNIDDYDKISRDNLDNFDKIKGKIVYNNDKSGTLVKLLKPTEP